MTFSAADIAKTIEHTLLKPEATPLQIDALCDEAVAHHFIGVCVNPVYVNRVAKRIEAAARGAKQRPKTVSVVGFPLGASVTAIKAEETRRAIDDGAEEIDMVVHVGAVIAGDKAAVRADIEALAHVVHKARVGGILKVILETTALTDEQIILGCRCAAEGEADFVKTSTGFHSGGGATIEHVKLLHKHSAPIRVKASGGIRTAAQAVAMLEAGASRLGTSSGVGILNEMSAANS